MQVQESNSGLRFDRIIFHILRKYDGFVVCKELRDGERLVFSKELGIVYARREDAIRGTDSLVRLSKVTISGKKVEWKE
jgi:hypothetical protein